jgi:hypothetical protein
MHLVEINALPIEGETNARDYDFSKAAVQTRWQAVTTNLPHVRAAALVADDAVMAFEDSLDARRMPPPCERPAQRRRPF